MLLQSGAQAHHYFAALFDVDKNIVVQGKVTDVSFSNPHVTILLEVDAPEGTKIDWVSQGDAATRFRLAGWTEDTVKLGDHLRVSGKGTHNGSPVIWIEQIELLDPTTGALIRELNPQNYSYPDQEATESTGK